MNSLTLVRRLATIVLALLLLAAARVEADSVTIAWDPNPEPDIAGYTVSWGTQSRVYTFSQNVVGATSLVVSNLQSGTTYYFVVQAYNTAGLRSAFSQEVSTLVGGVPAAPRVASFNPGASPPFVAGTGVTWTAMATGGVAPLQYQFWLYKAGTGWTLLRDWGTSNQAAWTPLVAGSYALQVWVRSAGSTAAYDAWRGYGPFDVKVGPVSVTAVTTTTVFPVVPGTAVTWTATATGGTPPLEYEFWLYHFQADTWTLLQAYGPAAGVTWTPSKAGRYQVQVWVRSTGSTALYEAWRNSGDAVVADAGVRLTAVTAAPALPVPVSTPVTLTATATGGVAPLEYQFWLYTYGTAQWTLLQDYTPANQVTWTPAEAGTYALQVWVRSAGSTAAWDDWKGLGPIAVVTQLPVVMALTPSVPPPLAVDVPMTWTASATGGLAPLEYQFWLYHEGIGWSLLQDYSPANQVNWTPPAADTYALQVWVRSAGSTVAYEAWRGSGLFQVQ